MARAARTFTAQPADQLILSGLNPANQPQPVGPFLEGVEGYTVLPDGSSNARRGPRRSIARSKPPRYVDDGNHRFSTSLAQHQDMVTRLAGLTKAWRSALSSSNATSYGSSRAQEAGKARLPDRVTSRVGDEGTTGGGWVRCASLKPVPRRNTTPSRVRTSRHHAAGVAAFASDVADNRALSIEQRFQFEQDVAAASNVRRIRQMQHQPSPPAFTTRSSRRFSSARSATRVCSTAFCKAG